MPLDLVVNPNFWLEPTRMGGEVVRVTILAPVRGRGLQYFFTDRKEHPEIFRLVTDIDQARRQTHTLDLGVIPEGSRETLYQMGVLVRPNEVSQPVRFHCFLDESILDWIPERCRQALDFDANPSDFIVNPTYAYQPGDKPPEVLAHRVQIYRQFLTGHPLVWIENPGTHLLTAYWVGKKESEVLALLKPGGKPPKSMEPRLRKILEMARILVPEDYPKKCRQEWEKLIERLRSQFRSRVFVTFSDLLPPFYLGALGRYYREIVAEGYAQKNDAQLPSRRVKHHEDMACFLHYQLSYLLSRIAERPLRPSHDYFYSYESGAVLPKHVDIDQEEFAMSLLIDYEPRPLGASPWPLFLESPKEGEIEISQEIGNAVFYNGSKFPHYRHTLPTGHRSASLVFHYVPQDFSSGLVDVQENTGVSKQTGQQFNKMFSQLDIKYELLRLGSDFGQIDRRERLSRDEFLDGYYSKNRPVVMTGIMNEWKALSLWKPSYFQTCFGDVEVEIMDNRDSNENYEIEIHKHKTKIRFRDYVERVFGSGGTNDCYLVANNNLFSIPSFQPLLGDIQMFPEFLNPALAENRVFFWMGPQGAVTPLHHDQNNILLAQVLGRKKVKLISPDQTHRVYNHIGVFSQVDLKRPDDDRFPLFKKVVIFELTLGAGEVLFIPVGWWHFVESLDPSISVSFTNFSFPNDFEFRNPKGELEGSSVRY